jgi:hypothetical protein
VRVALERLTEGQDWQMCAAVLTLHAIADEACAALGSALEASRRDDGAIYRARAR